MGGVYSTVANESPHVIGDDAPEVIISHTSPVKHLNHVKPLNPSTPPRSDSMNRNSGWKKNGLVDRTSFDDIRIPFKLLCDSASQTEQTEPVCTCDSSVQTDFETEESLINFTSVYLTESNRTTPTTFYCDIAVQTDFVDLSNLSGSYSSSLSDSCVQTDNVNIVEYTDAVNCYVQTDEECNEYYDIGEEVMRRSSRSRYTRHERHHRTASSIENESEEANESEQDDSQLQFDDLEEKAELDEACNDYSDAAVDAISEQIWNNYVNNGHGNGNNDNELYLSSISEGELVDTDEHQYIENQQPKTPEKKISGLYNSHDDLTMELRQREEQWQYKFKEQDKKIKEEIAMRELLEVDHREKLDALRKENKNMKQVVAQYEHVILELTEQTRDRQLTDATLSETINDKEQLQQDLNKAETSLVDAYKRIEKLKVALDTYKQNEESLKFSIKDFQSKLYKSEDRYKKLRQQATDKIDAANSEIQKVRKQKEIDLAGIQAALKKSQNRNMNLEKEIQQKMRENKELSQICDELIKKVSGETD